MSKIEFNFPAAATHLRHQIIEGGYDDLASIEFFNDSKGNIRGLRFDADLFPQVLAEVDYQIVYLDEMLEQEGFLLGSERKALKAYKRLSKRMREVK